MSKSTASIEVSVRVEMAVCARRREACWNEPLHLGTYARIIGHRLDLQQN